LRFKLFSIRLRKIICKHRNYHKMSERAAFPMEAGRMGAVWVASLAILGISAIGATREDALAGVIKALQTHSIADNHSGSGVDSDECEACT
jgi:hypothetical protein